MKEIYQDFNTGFPGFPGLEVIVLDDKGKPISRKYLVCGLGGARVPFASIPEAIAAIRRRIQELACQEESDEQEAPAVKG